MERLDKVFAKVGDSMQQIGGSCPDGFISMKTERPESDYIAAADGIWEKLTIQEPTPAEKIAALDAVYQPQFTALAQGAGLATLDGNEATLANIKEDYVVLKTEYKEKLEVINNG